MAKVSVTLGFGAIVSELRIAPLLGTLPDVAQTGNATLLLTAQGTVDTAVEAMKEGAYDYLTKPVDIQRLKILLDKANVKEALEIEKEMRRVTEELELLEGKLKLLKDKIAYSTITVAFEPRGSTIQATRIKLPFPWLQQLGLPTLLQLTEDR